MTFALSPMIARGIQNLIDRYVNDGYVVDFINIGCRPAANRIFNVADMALMAGLAIWILQSWRRASSDDRASSAYVTDGSWSTSKRRTLPSSSI